MPKLNNLGKGEVKLPLGMALGVPPLCSTLGYLSGRVWENS